LRPTPLLSALLTLALTSSAFAAIPLPNEKEKWVKLTSGELRIYSNGSERDAGKIANELLRMREALGRVTNLKVTSPLPTYVFVFRNERSFGPFRDAMFQRRKANVSGGFMSAQDANFIIMQGDAGTDVDRVIYHELTHYFVRNTLAGLPLWFHEGIAEYYSTFSSAGDDIKIGRPVPEHVLWLREGNVMPLAQLFAVDASSPEYSERRKQGVFYAESWALLHYLLTGNDERRLQLAVFLNQIRAGKPPQEAFQTAFHIDYTGMERELRSYVRKTTFMYTRFSMTDLQVPAFAPAQAVPRDEVLYVLGNLLAHTAGASDDAVTFLGQAVQANPKNAEAHAALGFVHERRKDRKAATASYEQAVALGSTDPNVYIIYGATIVERLNGTSPTAATRQELLRARQLFERAAQLEPSSSRALAGIGATYVGVTGDLTPGVTALEKSLALAASQQDVAFNLIQLYATAGRRADAQRVYDVVLKNGSDARLAQMGREALLLADVRVAEKLLKSGNYDEAVTLINGVLRQSSNEALKLHLQQVLTQIDQDVAQKRLSETVNLAIDKAKAGKYQEALALLDELLPTIKDLETKTRVVELRATIAQATGRKK
jgi:tetratricopeptide (TPR) repeat protein